MTCQRCDNDPYPALLLDGFCDACRAFRAEAENTRLAAELAEARASLEWPDGATSAASATDPPLPVETRFCISEWRALREAHAKTRAELSAVRKWLWLNHGCPTGLLYGDDGEMQCANASAHQSGAGCLDFKRDDLIVLIVAAVNGAEARADRAESILRELVAVVRGECPSLLNEDSGGDARLSLAIDEALGGRPVRCSAEAVLRGLRAWLEAEMVTHGPMDPFLLCSAVLAKLDALQQEAGRG